MAYVPCPESASNQLIKSEETKKAEKTCKEVCLRYSLPALFGTWYDQQCEKLIRNQKIEAKRKSGNTYAQKKDCVLQHLLEPLQLTAYSTDVHYRKPFKIINDYDYPEYEVKPKVKLGISTLLNEIQIEANKLILCEGSGITVSDATKDLRRNLFCFEPCHPEKASELVKYNEELYIRLYNSGSEKVLYLKCNVPHLETFGADKQRFFLTLTEKRDRFCIFKVLNAYRSKQVITAGKSVPSNARVIICHVMTNRRLAIEVNAFYKTCIFNKERLASCYNYVDVYKHPSSENFWMITSRGIGEDARIIDANKRAEEKRIAEEEEFKAKMRQRKAEREALLSANKCIRNPLMNFVYLP